MQQFELNLIKCEFKDVSILTKHRGAFLQFIFVKMLKVCTTVLSICACLCEYSANILIQIALCQL